MADNLIVGKPIEIRAAPSWVELTVLSVLGALIFFGTWQLVATMGVVSPHVLPSPIAVIQQTYLLEAEPFAGYRLHEHVYSSLRRFFFGFLLAVMLGVPLGLLMGRYRLIDEIATPLFEAYRYVAPLAWVPFAALWFGTGIGGPVMVIFTGAFAPCVVNAYRGAQLVERHLIEAAQTLGASNLRIVREVLMAGALPSILAGLRISAGLGWQSLIGAELIVVSSGIGYLMVQGQSNLAPAIVMSAMLVIGIIGVVIDAFLRVLEGRISDRWGKM